MILASERQRQDLKDWLETHRPGFKEWAADVRAEYAIAPNEFDPQKAIAYTEAVMGDPLAHESTIMLDLNYAEPDTDLALRPEDV